MVVRMGGPRSRHPSEECVSYHGQAADTCLWPQSRPGPLGQRFSRPPSITSARARHIQWAVIGRVFLCDAEVTNRRIEGDPAPLGRRASGPMLEAPETAAMGEIMWTGSSMDTPRARCGLCGWLQVVSRWLRLPCVLAVEGEA